MTLASRVTKLVKHFRSHPDILYFPNRHFYAGELLPCADPAVTHSLLKFEKLPAKNFPIIFHGIVGKDQREESSPSFFNVDEVTVVKDYLLTLLEDRKLRISTYASSESGIHDLTCMRSSSSERYRDHRTIPCSMPENSARAARQV